MRCYICDKALSEKETVYNKETKSYEPCTECLEIIMDAAYCDGFETEDDRFIILDDNRESEYSFFNFQKEGTI